MHRPFLLLCAALATFTTFPIPVSAAEPTEPSASAPATGEAPLESLEGGRSPDGRYELRQTATPFLALRLFNTETDSEIGHIALAQPRLPNPGAPSCQAIWHPEGEAFVLLDHDHKYSTRLSVHALFHGRLIALSVPDYIQNALGRVDATEATLPCWSRVNLWDGDDLPVALTVNAPDHEGKWVLHHAAVTLRLVKKPGRMPEIKLQSVKIEKTPGTAAQ